MLHDAAIKPTSTIQSPRVIMIDRKKSLRVHVYNVCSAKGVIIVESAVSCS